MLDNQEQSMFAGFSKASIILVNMLLVGVGGILVYIGILFTTSGWLDIFRDYSGWLQETTFWLLLGFGMLVIVFALIGCLAAFMENRCVLRTYSACIGTMLVLFLLISIAALYSSSTAKDWREAAYPANDAEVSAGLNFDKVYCYSQFSYYCHDGNVTETFQNFFPRILVGSIFNQASGLLDVCARIGNQSNIPQLQRVCDSCRASTEYQSYDKIYQWTLEECPATNASTIEPLEWCSKFIATGSAPGDTFNGAPYGICRSAILSFWENSALTFGLSTIAVCAMCILMLLIIIYLIRTSTKSFEAEL